MKDRWFITGVSGTGKTVFAKQLLRSLHRAYPSVPVYVLDTKQLGDFTGWPGGWQTQTPPPVIPRGVQVWQPPESLTQSFEQWMRALYETRSPLVLLIDELSSLGGEDVMMGRVGKYPRHLSILQKQGRAAGQSLITLSQEMAYIPRTVTGQTTHFVRFRLHNIEDARRADKMMGRRGRSGYADDVGEPSHTHGFYYARLLPMSQRAHYYRTLHQFF